MARIALSEVQRQRLIEYFGTTGTDIIEKHLDDLEPTFGSASAVIEMIMQGKMRKDPRQKSDLIENNHSC